MYGLIQRGTDTQINPHKVSEGVSSGPGIMSVLYYILTKDIFENRKQMIKLTKDSTERET